MKSETKFLIGAIFVTVILIGVGIFFVNKTGKKDTSEKPIDTNVLLADVRHSKGSDQAPVKIVEFGDFQCPACKAAEPVLKNVLANNQDKVYFVFRHYPLTFHKNAKKAAQAAESASIQGKFWEMHGMIYDKQKDWENSDDAEKIFEGFAKEIGLDVEKYKNDINTNNSYIENGFADGNKSGVESTPTFFINGQKYPGVLQEAQFQSIIDEATQQK